MKARWFLFLRSLSQSHVLVDLLLPIESRLCGLILEWVENTFNFHDNGKSIFSITTVPFFCHGQSGTAIFYKKVRIFVRQEDKGTIPPDTYLFHTNDINFKANSKVTLATMGNTKRCGQSTWWLFHLFSNWYLIMNGLYWLPQPNYFQWDFGGDGSKVATRYAALLAISDMFLLLRRL